MKLSLCITTYNRIALLIDSFRYVLHDPRIDEIVIVDDASDEKLYNRLKDTLQGIPKIKLKRQVRNVGMSLNKKASVEHAKNDWCIIFDSDNIITPDYIDAFAKIKKPLPDVIYQPDGGLPVFNFSPYAENTFNRTNIHRYINEPMFGCMLNACNYIVNRKKYLATYQYNAAMKGTDTMWFNYLWLKAGNNFYVVKDMAYRHLVHQNSGFMDHADYNMQKHKELIQLIKQL